MYALRHENDTYSDILKFDPSLIQSGGGKEMMLKDFVHRLISKEKYLQSMRFVSTHMYMFVK